MQTPATTTTSTPTQAQAQAPADWRKAYDAARQAKADHPRYDSGVRDAAWAIMELLVSTHSIPVERLHHQAAQWERLGQDPRAVAHNGAAYYDEGAAFTRAFIEQWAPRQ